MGKGGRRILRLLKWTLGLTLVVLVLGGAAAAAVGYLAYDALMRSQPRGEPVLVEVPQGASGDEVGAILADAGLVPHPLLFRAAIKLNEGGGVIKHGQYEFQKGLSADEILRQLQEGSNVPAQHVKLTIPEGLSMQQMAALFDDPEAFMAAAQDPVLVERFGMGADSLEGRLMPDTYFFDEEPTPREVVVRMAEEFQEEMKALLEEQAPPNGLGIQDVVTVASLVEEEARVEEERPMVAAVVYNRLERGMSLDMDSTLQYALNKYGERLLNADKETDSAYNTYRNRGLPPGPISNPGRAALRAAFQPADVEYLFFVSNADGRTHTFSETLQEHNQAVARYRREIAVQRREQRQLEAAQ